jgi:hypothetical protein
MENLSNQQTKLYKVLQEICDQNGEASFVIHEYNLYPVSPDSINPALADLQALLTNNLIGSFERTSSRGVKVTGIK